MEQNFIQQLGKEIRLIVCDLDNTLLDSQKTISAVNLRAVRAAQERGVFVTICSGRIHPMLEAYSRRLNIRGPLIAANGAVIYDTLTNTLPCLNAADREAVHALLEYCRKRGLDHIAATARGCWYGKNSRRIARFEQYNRLAASDGLPPIPLHEFSTDYRDVLESDIYKVLVSELGPEELRRTMDYVETLGVLSSTSSEVGLLDISAKGVSKGEGLRNLRRVLGLEKRQVCAFGDYWNDISMLEEAGLPVAVENAEEEVKKHALVVTASNDEDGVARAINQYILGEKDKNED
jgi:Cof subfamily protein (haloacid dehalogenase superfamily)